MTCLFCWGFVPFSHTGDSSRRGHTRSLLPLSHFLLGDVPTLLSPLASSKNFIIQGIGAGAHHMGQS